MSRAFPRCAAIAIACIVAVRAHATQPHAIEGRGGASALEGAEDWRLDFAGDNDSVLWPRARNYLPYDRWVTSTQQLRFRLTLPDDALRPLPPLPLLSAPLSLLPTPARVMLTASVGQVVYTPRTARIADLDELGGDRPYSGTLLARVGLDATYARAPLALVRTATPFSHASVEIDAGVIGPWSLAGFVQHHAHWEWKRLYGEPLPEPIGWGTIETAPRPTADVSVFGETSLVAWALPLALPATFATETAVHVLTGARGDLGTTLTAAAVNGTVLVGVFGDPLARAPAAFPLAAALFVRGETRAVAWNATIDERLVVGPSHAAHAPGVLEAQAGLTLRVWFVSLAAGALYRTNEIASIAPEERTGQLIYWWNGGVVF